MMEGSLDGVPGEEDPVRADFFAEGDEAVDVDVDPDLEPDPPPGIAPELAGALDEDGPDLFSLLGGLAALTQEVRIEGRNVRRLEERLAPLLEKIPELAAGARAAASEVAGRIAEARREGRAEMLGELLELRDRLARAVTEARARLDRSPGILGWLGGEREILEGLAGGTAAVLERLDEMLRAEDVREFPCVGRSFDPATMRAIDTGPAWGIAPGTVLEVWRSGFKVGERLLRAAEVKVSK